MTHLYVFDLDGTLAVCPEFYSSVYSASLDRVVNNLRGEQGAEMLTYFRQHCHGRGELALGALNIPFEAWAKELCATSLQLIPPHPELIDSLNSLSGIKVIYTGSPRKFALRVLDRLGFPDDFFSQIIGWEEPEVTPVKWTCTPLVFRGLLDYYECNPARAWSIGDSWDTDLKPAAHVGMRTAQIDCGSSRSPHTFSSVLEFTQHVLNEV